MVVDHIFGRQSLAHSGGGQHRTVQRLLHLCAALFKAHEVNGKLAHHCHEKKEHQAQNEQGAVFAFCEALKYGSAPLVQHIPPIARTGA